MPIIDQLASVDGIPDATDQARAVITSSRLAFVAGQVAMDRDGGLVGVGVGVGDIRAQTDQAVRNLGAVPRSW